MADRILFLGTGAAVANADHQNTHLLVQAGARCVLIDCPENPAPPLQRMGINLADQMTDLILTHFHADHVSGLAVMLQTAWLLNRRHELPVHGLEDTITRAERLLDLFDVQEWPGMFPLHFRRVAEDGEHTIIDTADLRVLSAPVKHLIPTIGLRFEFQQLGKSAAYSSDTEPADAVVRLAQGVDVLVHESTGAHRGHSSARQAGEIGRRAGAKKLYLIHYPTWDQDPGPWVDEARTIFSGEVVLAQDGMEVIW